MKVKEFIQKLNDIGYNDDTEIVFDLKKIKMMKHIQIIIVD